MRKRSNSLLGCDLDGQVRTDGAVRTVDEARREDSHVVIWIFRRSLDGRMTFTASEILRVDAEHNDERSHRRPSSIRTVG